MSDTACNKKDCNFYNEACKDNCEGNHATFTCPNFVIDLIEKNKALTTERDTLRGAFERLINVFDKDECPLVAYRGVSQCTSYTRACHDKQHLQCIYDHFIKQATEEQE